MEVTLNKLIEDLIKSKLMIYSVYFMILSYFYNLPVIKYSITGNNEFRLYDVVGVLILYIYMNNYGRINAYIRVEKTFLYLYYFLLWTCFTWVSTLIFSFFLGKYTWALQSLLYLYHFWVFYLAAVYLSIIVRDLDQLKRVVSVFFIGSIITFIIVILQNFGIIPFLWSIEYKKAYNFLSGTLGPNKIVLGMTCFFVFSLGIGILNDKRVKINKVLVVAAVGVSLLTLIMSGSRTSYVALVIFLMSFMILKTKSFIYSVLVFFLLIMGISVINPEVIDKATEVFEHRVENKIRNPDDVKEANIDELYEDLGSGRKGLSVMYMEYLLENPLYIPFGIGFNNRLMIGSSAHNMYLSLINEVGLVGVFLYFRWLIYFLFVRMKFFPHMKTALIGLVLAMLITLFFGEHLYVYRPLFGLMGLFLCVSTILLSPHYILKGQIKANGENK